MKKFIFTFLCLIFTLSGLYAQQVSKLRLQLFDQAPFVMHLNDMKLNKPQPNFVINSIPPGHHVLKVKVFIREQNRFKTFFKDRIHIPANRDIYAYIDPARPFSNP